MVIAGSQNKFKLLFLIGPIGKNRRFEFKRESPVYFWATFESGDGKKTKTKKKIFRTPEVFSNQGRKSFLAVWDLRTPLNCSLLRATNACFWTKRRWTSGTPKLIQLSEEK